MAGISPNPTLSLRRIHGIQCCSGAPGNEKWSRVGTKSKTPRILKFAVSGVTELLRLFSFSSKDSLDRVSCEERDEISVSGIDDVVMILMGDYENAYFVTGIFTSAIYAEDCLFEDPTIRFRGTDLYARNLKLLVPFFDSPSIGLQNIEKGVNSETKFVLAKWKLRLLGMLKAGMFQHLKQLARFLPLALGNQRFEDSRSVVLLLGNDDCLCLLIGVLHLTLMGLKFFGDNPDTITIFNLSFVQNGIGFSKFV
ncbi:uncharacterized protein LOC110662592 isoform X2 [Hevea brasiliensis]|uniref:uncharacterized protein LOC110662592 isoform X2 n=1 Tax=Hevea brasiliensis TaxID=3981 RepID=UPI0025F62E7C|nr:uncharacterized protein LOC110662592 isoform X2 [Hevea brasiliensis]